MIDFTLRFIEGEATPLIHAESSLGEASRSLSPDELAELYLIRAGTETLVEICGPEDELIKLGRRLYELVFQDGVRRVFERARDTSERDEAPLLILIKVTEDSPLQQIPWEILHDGMFLSKGPRSSVVRYFEQPRRQANLVVKPPLRVLLTWANPEDLPTLAVAREEEAIRLAYEEAGPLVDLVIERNVSLAKLEQIWREEGASKPFHVWHHCGHGGFLDGHSAAALSTAFRDLKAPRIQPSMQQAANPTAQEFVLYLEQGRRCQAVTVSQLQEIVGYCPELRVAMLNVCKSATPTGLAPALARLNVPIAIGFPHPVSDPGALRFAAAFHRSLLHIPPELASSIARRSTRIADFGTLDWSQVMVFCRRYDRGTLLQPNARMKPKPDQPRITQRFKRIKAHGTATVVNVESPAGQGVPANIPGIAATFDDVEAHDFEHINYRILSGFSGEQIDQRQASLGQLLDAVVGHRKDAV